jgi:hypothetical protein
MPELLAALDAFLQEHRRCGELDSGVENAVVWMRCTCGGQLVRVHNPRGMAT